MSWKDLLTPKPASLYDHVGEVTPSGDGLDICFDLKGGFGFGSIQQAFPSAVVPDPSLGQGHYVWVKLTGDDVAQFQKGYAEHEQRGHPR